MAEYLGVKNPDVEKRIGEQKQSLNSIIDILTEYNDNVSVFMTDDMKQHLFDLETETEDAITFDLALKNRMDNYYDEDNEDDIVTVLLNEVKKNLQLPTLDQLLDKVSEHGVESLTPYEKATLDNYSQK